MNCRFVPFVREHPHVFAYVRATDDDRIVVIANFSAGTVTFDAPDALVGEGACLVWNVVPRQAIGPVVKLAPYEAFALRPAA